jgi:exodeoxyribonuclease VII large subunit
MKKSDKLPFIKLPEQFENFQVFSVSELREILSQIVKTSFERPIIIRGVIASKPSVYPSFAYFDIKDEKENMMFNISTYIGNYYNIEKKLKATGAVEKLTEDVPVMLVVEPYVSTQKRISFMLRAIDVIPEYKTSILENEKNITINKLAEEGLLGLQKKLELPMLIKNVGLITSDQGTSVQDITSAIGEAAKFFNIIFQPVRVEGNGATTNIIDAITSFNKYAKKLELDVILIARGGGSAIDLAPFNDYELCKTVCLSKIPIITAIGHDKDEHAIELCSHITPEPSTPSGLGAFLKQHIRDVKEELEVAIQEVTEQIFDRFLKGEANVRSALSTVMLSINRFFSVNTEKLKAMLSNVLKDSARIFKLNENRLEQFEKLLDAYNHSSVLKRGYSVVWSNKGLVVKSVNTMTHEAEIEFVDGKVSVIKK